MLVHPLVLGLLQTVFADSSDDLYAPYNVSCPSDVNFVRKADSLSSNESDWVSNRDSITQAALIDWLGNSNLTDFDASSFLSNGTIRIGLAFSGGGYRAMLSGAGQFAALDNRTINSTDSGHMGGLVQAATYVSGLSGGNWLLSSLVVNNWTSVQELQGDKDVWDLSDSILSPSGYNIFADASYWDDVKDAVDAKSDAGYNTSITDIWGRCLSYQFFGFGEYGGINVSYHYVRDYDVFKNYSMPFPIHVADGRAPGTSILNQNSTCFEFNPFELGSWDPSVYSFTDLQYLGSNVTNGSPNSDTCVNGFDNVGFLTGTSSSLFNEMILELNSTGLSGVVYKLAESMLTDLGNDGDDIAVYSPNPFYGLDYIDNSLTSSTELDLVDGGEDGQNVPLYPLIQSQRKVDVVFAFDNSADTTEDHPLGAGWANGTSLVATYERQFGKQANNTIFPYVPDQDTFVYGGWAEQPTFFGCNRENLTSLFNSSQSEEDRYYPPVIIYMANTLHSYQGNTSTYKMSYDSDELAGMINNGYDVSTQNNGTLDSSWRSCVACAIVLREQQRRGESPTEQCQQCFDKYCWDGSISTSSNGTAGRRDGQSNIVNGSSAQSDSASAEGSSSGSSGSSSSSKSKNDGSAIASPALAAVLGLVAMFI